MLVKSAAEVIILKLAGEAVPDAYLEAALKENPTCGGISLCLAPGKLFADTTDEVGLDWVKDIQSPDNFKDKAILFYLGDTPQPFHLLTEGKNILLSGILQGDYSRFAEKDSKHSDKYLAVEKYFKPKIAELYELLGKDLKKLSEYLQKATIATEFGAAYHGQGSIALMSATTDILTYGNVGGGEFSWGATTNTFGYAEAATPSTTKITTHEGPPRELTRKEKIHLAKIEAGLIPADTPSPAVEVKPVEPGPDKKEDKPGIGHNLPDMEPDKDGHLSSEALMFKHGLPSPATGNKWAAPPLNSNASMKKKWYEKRLPNLIKGWKDSVPIQVPITNPMEAALAEAKAKLPTPTATAIPDKVNLPKTVPEIKPVEEKPSDVTTVPVLPAKLKEHIVDNYLKQPKIKAILDADGEEMLDPKSFSDIEKDFPNIVNELGLKNWGQLYRLFDYTECENISKRYPPLCALLAFWALHKCRGLEIQIAKGEIKKDTTTKNLPAAASSPEIAPPAPRKSAFGRH